MLKYPGGKARVAKSRILGQYPPPQFDEFRDVCCGACAMLPVLPDDMPMWVNDLDGWVYGFWSAVKSDGTFQGWIDEFCHMKRRTNHSATLKRRQFYLSKGYLQDHGFHPAHYLYVRRLAFRQIVRHTRPGIASLGVHQVRNGLDPVTRESLLSTRQRLQTVRITQSHYWEVLSAPTIGISWALIDPPYNIEDHNSGLYDIPWVPDQHRELRDKLLTLNADTHPFLLTLEESEISLNLYAHDPRFHCRREALRYSMTQMPLRGGGYSQKNKYELWITNYIPGVRCITLAA